MEPRVKTDMGVAAAALDYDAELMLRVKDGDGASFGLLLEKHRASVIHFLYRLVQEQAVAEELAQEVFLRVYRSRVSYEPTAKFTTWLFRIATHLALNWLRDGKHERGQERLDDGSPDRAGPPDFRPPALGGAAAGVRGQAGRSPAGGGLAARKATGGRADAQV